MMVRVGIIGSGFVGSATGEGFAKLGNEVLFYDISDAPLERLKSGGHKTTKNISEVVQNSDILFIAVPTPFDGAAGEINLAYIKSASEAVGSALAGKREYCVVVVRSTVVPKTTEEVV